MTRRENHESRMKRARWGTKGPLFRAPAPPKRLGEGEEEEVVKNVLAAWLEKNRRWVNESEVMTWLHREHGALVAGCVLPEEVTPENAVAALKLVRDRLRR